MSWEVIISNIAPAIVGGIFGGMAGYLSALSVAKKQKFDDFKKNFLSPLFVVLRRIENAGYSYESAENFRNLIDSSYKHYYYMCSCELREAIDAFGVSGCGPDEHAALKRIVEQIIA